MRRIVRLGAVAALATALVGIGFSAPAQAATNPWTPQAACNNDFGGSWSTTSDGHYAVKLDSGTKLGDVYLMYNSATGYNCVAVIKTAYVGSATLTYAGIEVQGQSTWRTDTGSYKYYAAVEAYAANKCVQYDGIMESSGGDYAWGGRDAWGNCG